MLAWMCDRRIGLLPLALVTGSLVACGGAPRTLRSPSPVKRSRLLLSDWTPPDGQTCNVYIPAGGIPAVDDFVDSAGLQADVERLWAERHAEGGRALFSISLRADSTGHRAPPVMIEDELLVEVAADLSESLENRPRPPRPKGPRVRLEVTVRSSPRFRAGASETCKPVLRNRAEIEQRLDAYAASVGRSGSAIVWVFISGRGDVRNALVEKSSGDEAIDQIALGVSSYMKFYPALNDRVPVPVWAAVPVSITVR